MSFTPVWTVYGQARLLISHSTSVSSLFAFVESYDSTPDSGPLVGHEYALEQNMLKVDGKYHQRRTDIQPP